MNRILELPLARDRWEDVERDLGERTPVVFLDFDGTLSPIVDDPAAAELPPATRTAVEQLMQACPVVVVSGRDADDVRGRVGLDGLVYAGSHGFDVIWPDGRRTERGEEYLDALRRATAHLGEELAHIPGVEIEAKRFAVAVHYRRAPADCVDEVDACIARLAEAEPTLRRSGGKRVFELRPDLDWDKGHTVLWLLEELGVDGTDWVPVYLGDDLTDEDAFAALERYGSGLGLVVRGESDERATAAHYAIEDVYEAAEVLQGLARLAAAR